MTDKERWIAFMDSFEIGWHLVQGEEGKQTLQLRSGDSKTIGYNYFVFEIYFDEEGKFIETGIWEN